MMKKNQKSNKKNSKVRGSSGVSNSQSITYPFPPIPKELIQSGNCIRIHDQFPDSALVELRYNDGFLERTNSSSSIASWRFVMNSVYDPDPTIGSGSVAGHNIWGQIYSTYRVLGLGYNVTFTNNETFGVQVLTCPTTFDLGNNSANTEQFGEAKYGQSRMLSAKGGQDRATISGYVNLSEFFGKSYLYDSTFNSSVAGSPATLLYLNLGVNAGSNSLTAGGVIQQCVLTYHVLYYRKQNIFT